MLLISCVLRDKHILHLFIYLVLIISLFFLVSAGMSLGIGFGSEISPSWSVDRILYRDLCPPVSARLLYWNWTQPGDLNVQPCPGGATGLARWRCIPSKDPSVSPHRYPESPDLSECRSVWLTSLEGRITEGDTIISIVNDLCQVSLIVY